MATCYAGISSQHQRRTSARSGHSEARPERHEHASRGIRGHALRPSATGFG
jgi:hypothetical protein